MRDLVTLPVLLVTSLSALGCATTFSRLDLEGCNAVPLREEGGLLLVDVTVEHERFPVIVDTGSALSLTLHADQLVRAGAAFDGSTRTFRDARGHVLVARGARLPELRLGDALFRDVRVWESVHAPDWAPPVDAGHIGRALLSATRLTVDVPKRMLHADGPSCPLPPGDTIELAVDGDGLTTTARRDGRPVTLAWDTAATGSVLHASSGHGDPVTLEIAPGTSAAFAAFALPGLPVDGLVGVDVFRRQAVLFDVEHRMLRLVP